MSSRQEKITFGEMRESGVRGVLVYCDGCGGHDALDADAWSDNLRLSEIEHLFVCQACGKRGAEIRPNFSPAEMGTGS